LRGWQQHDCTAPACPTGFKAAGSCPPPSCKPCGQLRLQTWLFCPVPPPSCPSRRTSLRLSYLPVLRGTLARPLVSEGKDGIEAVLRMMRAYCISREDFDFVAGGRSSCGVQRHCTAHTAAVPSEEGVVARPLRSVTGRSELSCPRPGRCRCDQVQDCGGLGRGPHEGGGDAGGRSPAPPQTGALLAAAARAWGHTTGRLPPRSCAPS
jgi:hypothetical protein